MAFGNLKFDTLTTSDSLKSSTEKSINTSFLLNGVAKATANTTASGTSNSDAALNISSVADGGTGLNTINVTSAFSAAKAAVPNISNHDSSYARGTAIDDTSTSAFVTRIFQADNGALTDSTSDTAVTIHGDLA
jgi:hypothetical protein